MPIRLPDDPAARASAAAHDGRGGDTLFSRIAGLAAGTPVPTPGGMVAVETLATGDTVIANDGLPAAVVWRRTRHIDAPSLARQPQAAPVLIGPGTFGPAMPAHPLTLAPDQAILLDGAAATAALLVDGAQVRRDHATAGVTYVEIGLDRRCVLSLDGIGYGVGGHTPTARGAVALRRRLGTPGGALRSQIEAVTAGRVVGWALDADRPTARVALEITHNGEPIAWGFADQRRPDLEMAGLGDGACAFDIRFDAPPGGGVLEVCRATDGTQLNGSPVLLAAATPAPLGEAVRAAVARAATPAARLDLAAILSEAATTLAINAGQHGWLAPKEHA